METIVAVRRAERLSKEPEDQGEQNKERFKNEVLGVILSPLDPSCLKLVSAHFHSYIN